MIIILVIILFVQTVINNDTAARQDKTRHTRLIRALTVALSLHLINTDSDATVKKKLSYR